jgi:heme exporter protein A
MSTPFVSLDAVGVRFGHVPVLTGISLSVHAGEVVGVAGPNGAGKTTLLGVISTLIRPTTGTGTVFGAAIGSAGVFDVRNRIGWSGHDPALYPELTLLENLLLTARLAGLTAADARHALHVVGLTGAGDRRADRSSNGMQRRVDLARLVMLDPDLVLLDEAHAGLDVEADRIIAALLQRARSKGKAAVLVSHDANRLSQDADRVITIERGTGR